MRTGFTRMLENKLREFYNILHIDITENLEQNSYNLIIISEDFREKKVGKKGAKKRIHTDIFRILKDHINTGARVRIEKFNILSMADTDWNNTLIFKSKDFKQYSSKEMVETFPSVLVK